MVLKEEMIQKIMIVYFLIIKEIMDSLQMK